MQNCLDVIVVGFNGCRKFRNAHHVRFREHIKCVNRLLCYNKERKDYGSVNYYKVTKCILERQRTILFCFRKHQNKLYHESS